MIKICKNFTPKVDLKRSSASIKNKEDSNRVLAILDELEDFLDEPISKFLNPYSYELCEELIEIVCDTGLEVEADDHLYFTKTIKAVQYWHLYREVEYDEGYDEDDYFSEPRDEYFLEKVGFE